MEYDLINLFDHPLSLFELIPATIVTLGRDNSNHCVIDVEWKRLAGEPATESKLTLKWDLDALRARNPLIDRQIETRRTRDEDQATRTEETAIVVAVAVLTHIERGTTLSFRSRTGSSHDYYLNESRDEMIEIAGKWKYALPSLFEEKRKQSNQNANLRKRWVSVTVMRENPRNRTEGLHS
jgi:hypothetical protein